MFKFKIKDNLLHSLVCVIPRKKLKKRFLCTVYQDQITHFAENTVKGIIQVSKKMFMFVCMYLFRVRQF